MNQLEHRFLLNVKNYIKKSVSLVLLGVEPCGNASNGVRWSSIWGLPNFLIDGREAIEIRAKESDVKKDVLDEHLISQLFVGFFNNKMTLPMFLIQSSGAVPGAKLVESTVSFLDDVYRHMLTKEQQCQYRLIFKWLKIFFKKLPAVSYAQRQKALMFIQQIYFALGIHPKFNAEGKKL